MATSQQPEPIPAAATATSLPNFLLSIKLKYVKLGYHYLISHGMYLLLTPIIAVVSIHISTLTTHDMVYLWDQLRFNLVAVVLCAALLVFLATLYFMSRPRKVYLVDFSAYKPEDARLVTRELFMDRSIRAGTFTQENLAFQKKILERSGLGQKTYFPDSVLQVPPNPCMAEARKEAEMVMYGAIDDLLAKSGLKAKDIGILIVNCSLFCPTPSLSSMIVNHYKLRGNIMSYNLGGMGCSAGLIAIDLAKQLLQPAKRNGISAQGRKRDHKDLLQPRSLHLSSNLQNPTSEHPLLPLTPSEITAEPSRRRRSCSVTLGKSTTDALNCKKTTFVTTRVAGIPNSPM